MPRQGPQGLMASVAPTYLAGRRPLRFRDVNRRGKTGFQSGVQRHHLLPRQLLGARCFGTLFDTIGCERVGFDDFRCNGLLLPAADHAAVRMNLPLHRGPHRDYNAMVAARAGQIESDWAGLRRRAPEIAAERALMRLRLLQRALRKRLLTSVAPFRLNKNDRLGQGKDFDDLDRMAEILWQQTGGALAGGAVTAGLDLVD